MTVYFTSLIPRKPYLGFFTLRVPLGVSKGQRGAACPPDNMLSVACSPGSVLGAYPVPPERSTVQQKKPVFM